MKRILFAVVVALAACRESPPLAPAPRFDTQGAIAGQYIVVLHSDVTDVSGTAAALATSYGGTVRFTYEHALRGFSIAVPDQLASALAQEPSVSYVVPNGEVHLLQEQPGATWGIDRVDQHDLPLGGTYVYNATGAGVEAHIIDTGIRKTHVEFGGRAFTGVDEVTPGGTADDCHGHGTHVSGTVGGYTWGLAKGVTLYAVRVLDCFGSGSWDQVIAGIDWVTARKAANPATPMVANMSLGGGFNQAVNDAVTNSIAQGVNYAIAAGNSSNDACTISPASTPDANTAAASDINDNEAGFSSFGPCVDIFGPGVNVTSSWNSNDEATNTISGTSMATPHVTGSIALYLETNPAATPAQVTAALKNNATPDKIINIAPNTANLLLYTANFSTGVPVPPQPVASFTFNCPKARGGRQCSFNGSGSSNTDGVNYAWDFGDGSTGSGVTTTHTYQRKGTFFVRLTVRGGEGQTHTKRRSVTTGTAG